MKYFCFILQLIRKGLFQVLFLKFLLGCFWFCSCEDNIEQVSYSSRVEFNSEIRSSWTHSTRSMAGVDEMSSTVVALQGGAKTLFLHTLYTDSIASVFTEDYCDTTVLTRATPVTNANMYHKFGISAYSYIGSWSESRMPNYFYNVIATKNGNTYTLPSTYYWPGVSYKIKFFAYAPVGKGEYQLSGIDYPGSPVLNVRIPGDVSEQADLLVAKTEELNGNHGSTVPLVFHHAMTAVRFECGNDMQDGTVKSISLKNVYSKGTFNMGTLAWGPVNTPATFSHTLNKSTSGTPGEALTTDAQTFMMLPQTLPEKAQLEVVFTDNAGTDYILTATINGTVWPMGKTVTYKISSSSINWTYTLEVSQPSDFTYLGGTQKYSVTSYRQSSRGGEEAVAWTTQYSEDGIRWTDTKPVWLTDFTASGSGGSSAQFYDATVNAQNGTYDNSHTTALQNAPVRGNVSSPYNLSNQTNGGTTVQNTANCYMVSAPGYYSFPLVYGNAIKNSKTNESAYKTNRIGSSILSRFINHTGNDITNPYISKNAGCTPSEAELVWQDAPNLITDIKYNDTDNGNISFTVNKNTIQQGNAVIAIKDVGNNVLWSWHIWVTDEDISNVIEVTNYSNRKYEFMPVNLGWCDGYVQNYAERNCKIRFTAGNQCKEITIKQASSSIVIGGNNPYYQWGRKDPFLPSNGLYTNCSNKTWYNKDGVSSTNPPATEDFTIGIACIKNFILNPNVMHNQKLGQFFYNLWNANCFQIPSSEIEVVKTIYDPSPVGFKLPNSYAFTGFSVRGGRYLNQTYNIKGVWDNSLRGWNFYTNNSKNKTIFFSAAGYRSFYSGYRGNAPTVSPGEDYLSGEVYDVGTEGDYWMAEPNSSTSSCNLFFTSLKIDPKQTVYRSWALSVRPSRE